jgi:hypothetical protein
MNTARSQPRTARGAPLALLALILVGWIGARAAVWENPLPPMLEGQLPVYAKNSPISKAGSDASFRLTLTEAVPREIAIGDPARGLFMQPLLAQPTLPQPLFNQPMPARPMPSQYRPGQFGAQLAAGPARGQHRASSRAGGGSYDMPQGANAGRRVGSPTLQPPLASPLVPAMADTRADRWSLDAWAFYREGSGVLPGAQGRLPIYGASQAGARLNYRFAPRSARDPQAFLRVYRALVDQGESEVALGLSARPLASLPVRLTGEVRAVDDPLGTDIRPAGYAVTEIAPLPLVAGAMLEVYGAAGYVGGQARTAFVDGQAVAAHPVLRLGANDGRASKLSVGAGAWGGAQRDASRLDVGPTVRLDLSLADVPARLSLDYRERVAGDAAPGSGVAATISTRF